MRKEGSFQDDFLKWQVNIRIFKPGLTSFSSISIDIDIYDLNCRLPSQEA